MAVRFVLGRSGSGKTHHCLDAVLRQLAESPDGPALILLVPDQATFQIEQALLADGRVGGYHRARVCSFSRLARQVVAETGPPAAPVLSESARRMVLRRLLQELAPTLSIFSRTADRPGFIAQLAGMIRELRQYRKTPDDLRRQCEALRQNSQSRPGILIDKLSDLAAIFQAYQDFITGRFVDPDDFFDLAAARFDLAHWIRGASVWLDGFAGFTPQQYRVLLALIACARRAEISLCLDPRSDQAQLAQSSPDPAILEPTDLFHPTLLTYQRLLDLFAHHHLAVEPSLILDRPDSPPGALPRFQASPRLSRLERDFVMVPAVRSQAGDAGRGADARVSDPAAVECSEQIVIVEAPDPRREVEAVARRILQLCREKKYRFRDIAVILRDFQQYSDLIETIFDDHSIAYFMDQPRPIRHHPLVELIRSVLEVLTAGFEGESIFRYLRTGLAGLDPQPIDCLENYVLAHGVGPGRWLDDQPWPVDGSNSNSDKKSKVSDADDDVDRIRRNAVQPLLMLRRELYGDDPDPKRSIPADRITAALSHLLDQLGVRGTLTQWYHQAHQQGRPEDAQTHRQVYAAVVDLLNDVVLTLEQASLTLDQYEQVVAAAFETMKLGLVPPRLDQVLVGAIERSRHPHVRAAFILGVNEGRFPQSIRQDSLLSDDQRQRLLDDQFELAPAAAQRQLHENYLAYIAVTRPSDFLWVSYPVADQRGNQLCPSFLIEIVSEASGGLACQRLNAQSDPDPQAITNLHQLAEHLAAGLVPCQRGDLADSVDPVWLDLLRFADSDPVWRDAIRRPLAGLFRRNDARIDPDVLSGLFGATLDVSVSRIESFAACPFQHFARYVLRLAKRDELQLAAVELGSFYHRALCEMFRRLQRDGLTWQTLDDDRLKSLIDGVVADLFNSDRLLGEMRRHSARNSNIFREACLYLNRFCRSLRAAARAGDFEQKHAELSFGFGRPVAGLELKLGSGRILSLHGVIDRVDTCRLDKNTIGVCLIDYKSSSRVFDWAAFYHGLNVQLISYLDVLGRHYAAQTSNVAPVAALYQPILRPGQSQPGRPPDFLCRPDEPQPEIEIIHKARGVISSLWFHNLDRTVAEKKRSKFYGVYRDRNGSIENSFSRDVVAPKQMDDLLAHGRRVLMDLGRRMLGGDIAVRPYRLGNKTTPCSSCDFQSVCRFDFSLDDYRFLPQFEKSEVLDRIGGSA